MAEPPVGRALDIAGAPWSPSTVSDDLDGPFGHRYERAACGDLFGDDSLVPIKGQLVVLRPQPGIDYLTVGGGRFSTRGSQYMFPCGDGILLGGTYQRGVETLEPDPVETERILADDAAFFGAMEGKGRSLADPARRAWEWRVVRGR